MIDFEILPAGDSALLVQFPSQIDPAISARAIALAEAVERAAGTLVRDLVVGYCSLTVYFDPLAVDAAWLEETLRSLAADCGEAEETPGPLIDVPVCYGGELGPDLADVAVAAACSEEDVVELHTGVTYRVYVVGFVPGFPYMASVDPRLALPRRATPRTKVPALSVAIAAGQTGIYPTETPGGWHLIGRTPVKPYDPGRPQPFLFRPGDRVRFHAIDRAEFDRLG
jgi:KipI family sensor histidine kinase inhibitor